MSWTWPTGREVTWATDMTSGEPALLLALLVSHGQEVLYMPGRLVNRASDGYRGEGKTDARDAYVIADQALMRRDLRPTRPGDEAAIELKLLTGRRSDLVEDRTRVVNRLRGTLLSMFPALERALDVTNAGPLKLLTGYQTPAVIRRAGVARLTKWLANRKVRSAKDLAEAAVEAAARQHTAVPGEKTIAKLVHTLAEEVMALNAHASELDKLIEGRFREHELADIGATLGAEFLAAVGGDLDEFDFPDALATFAASPQHLATRARSAATSTGRSPTTADSSASFTPPRSSASATTRTHGSSTTETRGREEARPGRARPRPPTCQRHLGPDPRPTVLRSDTADGYGRLTTALGSLERPPDERRRLLQAGRRDKAHLQARPRSLGDRGRAYHGCPPPARPCPDRV